MGTYLVQTNFSVQTVQTNCGEEVGGRICKSVIRLQILPPTSSPQLVCTVCTERLVCTRYVPFLFNPAGGLLHGFDCANYKRTAPVCSETEPWGERSMDRFHHCRYRTEESDCSNWRIVSVGTKGIKISLSLLEQPQCLS